MTDSQPTDEDIHGLSRRTMLRASGALGTGSFLGYTFSAGKLQRSAAASELDGSWDGLTDAITVEDEDGQISELDFTETSINVEWENFGWNEEETFNIELHARDDESDHQPGDSSQL